MNNCVDRLSILMAYVHTSRSTDRRSRFAVAAGCGRVLTW